MKNLVQSLQELERELEKVSQHTLHRAGELGEEAARKTDLFKHGDNFEQQIQFQSAGSFQGTVESGAEYSHYLEYGNNEAGDTIYPKQAKALHFFANGEEVFTKKVKAHGPLPFMDQAADKVEHDLPTLWAEEFDKHIR